MTTSNGYAKRAATLKARNKYRDAAVALAENLRPAEDDQSSYCPCCDKRHPQGKSVCFLRELPHHNDCEWLRWSIAKAALDAQKGGK